MVEASRVNQTIVSLFIIRFKFVKVGKQREGQLKGLESSREGIIWKFTEEKLAFNFAYLNDGSEHSYYCHSPYTLGQFKIHSLGHETTTKTSLESMYILIY